MPAWSTDALGQTGLPDPEDTSFYYDRHWGLRYLKGFDDYDKEDVVDLSGAD